jgi:hypothetical protein
MLWHYRYRLNGKQERVTLGRYPALSLKLARAERDKRETLVAQGQSPAVQKRLAKQRAAPDTTVAEFGERFFRDVVAKDRRDLTIPRRYFDKSIVPAIGTKAVRDVTTEDVRAIIWRKKDDGFDAAAGNIRSVLKRLFDDAQTAGLVTTNPVLALPIRHVHKGKAHELAGGSEAGDLRCVHHAERKFGTLRSLRQCKADRVRQSQRRILCANRVVTTQRSQ